jgi:hypothetical protein
MGQVCVNEQDARISRPDHEQDFDPCTWVRCPSSAHLLVPMDRISWLLAKPMNTLWLYNTIWYLKLIRRLVRFDIPLCVVYEVSGWLIPLLLVGTWLSSRDHQRVQAYLIAVLRVGRGVSSHFTSMVSNGFRCGYIRRNACQCLVLLAAPS